MDRCGAPEGTSSGTQPPSHHPRHPPRLSPQPFPCKSWDSSKQPPKNQPPKTLSLGELLY